MCSTPLSLDPLTPPKSLSRSSYNSCFSEKGFTVPVSYKIRYTNPVLSVKTKYIHLETYFFGHTMKTSQHQHRTSREKFSFQLHGQFVACPEALLSLTLPLWELRISMLTLAVTCLGTCTVKDPRFRVPQAFRGEQRLLRIKQEILSNSLFVKKAQCINIHYMLKNIHFHQYSV